MIVDVLTLHDAVLPGDDELRTFLAVASRDWVGTKVPPDDAPRTGG